MSKRAMVITTKIYNMRNIKLLALLLILVSGGVGNLYAQYDDLYYDPAKDKGFFADYKPNSKDYSRNDNYAYNDDDYYQDDYYDDEGYEYYDDYDYYYTSRIRRFHNPYYGFSFFDPVYLDMAYYDPFFSPGMTMLIYDDVFAFNNWYRFNRWNRWNRWNAWGPSWGWNSWNGVNINFNFGTGWGGWNNWGPSWGWNSWNRWNNWGPSWGFNNYYVNNFYGYGGGFYCPPTWGSGYVYNTVNEIRSNTVYGPRMNGTTKTPQLNGREIRRETPKDVTNSFPRTTTDGVTLPNDRIQPNNPDNPEKEVTGREKAHTERFSIFDEKEKADYGRTIDAIRDGRTSDLNRSDRTRTNTNNNRIDRRWDSNDRTRSTTNPRSYDPNSRTRTRDIEAPRTRSYEPTRRSNSSNNNTRSNEIRRNNSNTRSSSPSMNNTRSSSPTRSQMGSTRSSSGSSTRSSGSSNSGSSRSGSNNNSSNSSRRGGNN